MHNMITDRVSALSVPGHDERAGFRDLERSISAHKEKQRALACLNTVEVNGQSTPALLDFPFNVAAWNLQRGLFPAESAALLKQENAALVMLSEMDNGMARTGQRHPTAEMAEALSMQYAYGVEFIELGLGNTEERPYCRDDFNAKGFHGNAMMGRVELNDAFILPLSGDPIWFLNGGDQPRVGARMAIGAVIETISGPMLAISTHLESHGDIKTREIQTADILELADRHFSGLPVLIGGDLNTGNRTGGDFNRETLFTRAAQKGYLQHSGGSDAITTRQSLISKKDPFPLKLDWFLTRGLEVGESRIVPALGDDGTPLSDHDMITCRITGFTN